MHQETNLCSASERISQPFVLQTVLYKIGKECFMSAEQTYVDDPSLYPWEKPEKYMRISYDTPQKNIYQSVSPDSSGRILTPHSQKTLRIDGIGNCFNDYERIICKGKLVVSGIRCKIDYTSTNPNGQVLVVEKKLVIEGINNTLQGLICVQGNTTLDGCANQIDRRIQFEKTIKRTGFGNKIL